MKSFAEQLSSVIETSVPLGVCIHRCEHSCTDCAEVSTGYVTDFGIWTYCDGKYFWMDSECIFVITESSMPSGGLSFHVNRGFQEDGSEMVPLIDMFDPASHTGFC